MIGWIIRASFRCLFALAVAGILILAAVRAYGQHRYDRARLAFVERVGPLDVAQYQPPVFMDSYWLTDGVEAIELGRHANTVRYLGNSSDEAWKPDQRRRLADLLERNRAALGVLHGAGGRRLGIGLDVEQAVLADSIDFRAFARATRLLHLEGRLRMIEGRSDLAVTSALALGSLSGALLREPLLASQVAGSVAEGSYLDLVRRLLPAADPEALASLRANLAQLEPALPALRRSLGAEASAVVHALNAMNDAPIADEATPWRRGVAPGPIERLAYRWTQELQLAEVLERYSRLVATAERPYTSLARGLARPGRGTGLGPWLLADLMVPNLIEAIERIQATASARQLAALAVDLRLAALEQGAYPPALPNAGTRSPYTAEAIQYRRLPDGTVTLTYAEAEALWREHAARAQANPLTLTWSLPPPR